MKKRRRAEQIVGLLRQADVDLGKGVNVPNVCRRLGISPLRPLPWVRPALMRAGVPKPTNKLVRSSMQTIPQPSFPHDRTHSDPPPTAPDVLIPPPRTSRVMGSEWVWDFVLSENQQKQLGPV